MGDDVFDVQFVLGLLRRRARLILVTICLSLAVAAIAIFALKPAYTASTLVLVDTARKDLLAPDTQANTQDNGRVDSEVELVKSEATLLRVISDKKLVDDPEFGVKLPLQAVVLGVLHIQKPVLPTGDQALQGVLFNLREALNVQRRGLTNLIAIDAKAQNPQTAALIANAVAAAYIHDQLQSKIDATLSARDIIQSRIAEASAAVASSESAFDDFIAANMDAITAATGRSDLAELRSQLGADTADSARLTALADSVASSAGRSDWQSVADSLKSDAVKSLNQQRKALEQSLAGAASDSADAVNVRAALAKINTSLGSEVNAELVSLKGQVAAAQAKAADLRAQLRTSVLGSNLPAAILTDIYGLQQSSAIARSQYQALLGRLNDLETQAFLQVADSRIVSPALPPGTPSFPNPKLILGLALIAGLGLGVALAFIYENFIGGFTSEDQVSAVLRTPVLAGILRQKQGKQAAGGNGTLSLADFITQAPLSVFSESVRRVRVGIDQAVRRLRLPTGLPSSGAVIMITSATPGEGKTTMALSLSRAYSLSGKSTILIDCDLRKPSVHKQAGIEPSSGLLDYLSDPSATLALTSIVWIDQPSGVQIVVGARRSDIETDQLVTSTAFAHLLDEAKKNFDVVILDTPPVGSVVDGLYLAQFVDVIVFVTRWSSTPQKDARNAVAALTEAKTPHVEILAVLNQQIISKSRYRSQYSGYYVDS